MVDLSRFSLEGKVALVTGASRGIGQATAMGFAKAGADVAVASRKLPDLEKVADEIREVGRKALPVAAHIGKMEDIGTLVKAVMAEFGRIDILVNNAGGNPALASCLDADERLWDNVVNLNLKGVYFLSQAVARMMKEQGGGKIINTASIDAYKPEWNVSIYTITKAAVTMLTKCMALELAQYNIRVNAIAPGSITTRLFDSHWFHLSEEEAKAEKAKTAKAIPMQRFGDPDDIVGVMIYLASDASSYTTGETIVVDGGMLVGPMPQEH